jgi:hypothetical protein
MKYTQNRLKYTKTDSHPCCIAHSNVCTQLFGRKMHSDWFHSVDIVQGRGQHGEEVGYWYPCRLEKTICKWDIYVPRVMKGLYETEPGCSVSFWIEARCCTQMKYTQNRLKYSKTDSHPCCIAHSNVCTELFGGKIHSDWFHRVDIVQFRWQHGEEVGYWYPCRLEKTICKWDIYVPRFMKGLYETEPGCSVSFWIEARCCTQRREE